MTYSGSFSSIKFLVLENRRITIKEVAEYVRVLICSYHAILGCLGNERYDSEVCVKIAKAKQKQRRYCIGIAQDLLSDVNDNPDLPTNVASHWCRLRSRLKNESLHWYRSILVE